MNAPLSVGFIGLGNMGGPMSANVQRAGFATKIFDLNADLAAKVAEGSGAAVVSDSAELGDVDVLVLMLPTSRIVRAALLDDEGALRIPLRSGAIVVDMSSSDPTDTVETGRLLAAHGIEMVDAPVSGGTKGAEGGTLAIMMGGNDDAAVERATPVIEAMSRVISRTGGLGSGHATKALNNYLAAAAFAASSEALAIGAKFGLDQAVLLDVIEASTGQSWNSTHVLGPHIVERKFASGFALPLITKDVQIAERLAEAVGLEAPVLERVGAQFNDALEGLGNVDHTLAYQYWLEREA